MIKVSDNDKYKKEYDLMEEFAPDMMKRKIFSSLHQSAQMLHHLLENMSDHTIALSVGAYEDMPTEVLTNMGFHIAKIDPVLNMDLHTYRTAESHNKFDVIFSTSAIEHAYDDEQFIADICDLLKPGGLCFITCDFKPDYAHGDRLPATCVRFYTKGRLEYLADVADTHGCILTEEPQWDVSEDDMDFQWEGIDYCFMGMSFMKKEKK
jgi:SAM-dependent methyltransferase